MHQKQAAAPILQNRCLQFPDARFLAALVFGVLGDPAAAADQRTTDMWLEQAGFIMKPANTPAHVKQMESMPPRRFVVRTSPAGKRYFLYADPADCKCVFVGDEAARRNFQSIASARLQQPDNVPAGGTSTEQMVEGMDRDMDGNIDGAGDPDLFTYPF
jgi:hypothetical protein